MLRQYEYISIVIGIHGTVNGFGEQKDFETICKNAIKYNASKSRIHKAATNLLRRGRRICQQHLTYHLPELIAQVYQLGKVWLATKRPRPLRGECDLPDIHIHDTSSVRIHRTSLHRHLHKSNRQASSIQL